MPPYLPPFLLAGLIVPCPPEPPPAEHGASLVERLAAEERRGAGEPGEPLAPGQPPPTLAAEEDRAMLAFSAGLLGVLDEEGRYGLLGVEYRFPTWELGLVPAVGFFADAHSDTYLYGLLRYPIDLGRGWQLAPGFGGGWFEEAGGLDLGSPLEFRSSLEISRPVGDHGRLGLEFYHLSNGSITDFNPGTEVVVLTWSMPIGG